MKENPGAAMTVRNKTAAAIGLALALATLALYAPALGHAFINFDDDLYVTDNPMARAGWTWRGAAWAFTTGYGGNWHPLTWLSHMTDCAIFGLNPAGHHATSALFHAANTVLLFFVLRRMTGSLWRAAAAAALFGWHPLRVESVAWVAERKDVLGAFFFFLTIWFYAGFVRDKRPAGYWLALLSFMTGLLCKPMLVTLPFVLLLLDYWPLERFGPGAGTRLALEKTPFFALSAVASVVTYLAQKSAGNISESVPLVIRAGNAVLSYGRYLGRMIWPAKLAVIYPYNVDFQPWEWCAACLLLAGVTWLAFQCRRRYLAACWCWYLGTLAPVIGLVQAGSQSSADRYTYIPLVGIFVMIVWGAAELAGRWRLSVWLQALAAVCVLAACAWVTEWQLGYWADSGTLFERALAVTTNNDQAWNGLGVYRLSQKDDAAAFRCFNKALTVARDNDGAWYNLGMCYWRHGRNQEAWRCFTESLLLRQRPSVCYHAGLALKAMRRPAEAARYFARALVLGPDYIPARMSLADSLANNGRNEQAAREYRKVLQLDPGQVDAHCNLACVLAAQGRTNEAMGELRQAIRLRPSDASSHCNLGNLLLALGDWEQAAAEYRAALRSSPGSPEIHSNLGTVLALQGRRRQARDEFNEALRLAPDFTQAKDQLKTLGDP